MTSPAKFRSDGLAHLVAILAALGLLAGACGSQPHSTQHGSIAPTPRLAVSDAAACGLYVQGHQPGQNLASWYLTMIHQAPAGAVQDALTAAYASLSGPDADAAFRRLGEACRAAGVEIGE